MATPSCILNNILVELPKAFQDEISSGNGVKLYKDTTFRPEWNATISGIVASVPTQLTIGDGGAQSLYFDRPNINQIVQVGDEIIFSYLVIMNRSLTNNVGEIYERDKPIDPYITTWTNPNKLRIFRVYKNNNFYECGLFDLKTKQWIDRVKCNESGAEEFLGKYMPTENSEFNYKNLLPYDGHDYWKVDYINAIAIKRKGGNFDMIGEYVLVEPIREPRNGFEQGIIEVYNIEKDKDKRAIGRVVSIGEPIKGQPKLSIKKDDTICTDIRYVQKYEIDGHDYWIIRQKHIFGKQSVANEYKRDS
jgi:co-chaperonin GroES (HSP10)